MYSCLQTITILVWMVQNAVARLIDPALQRASPTLYFPTPSTALSLYVLPSIPAVYFYTVAPVTYDRA